jgi:hypothetical protein
MNPASTTRSTDAALQHPGERSFRFRLHLCAKTTGRKKRAGHTKLLCDLENAGISNIRDNDARLGIEAAIANPLQDRATIASLARPEDPQPDSSHRYEQFMRSTRPVVE